VSLLRGQFGLLLLIRAEEHLANTPRQLMVYAAFGWTPPRFAHAALILNADRTKMSKREGEAAVGGGVAADEADGRQGAFSDALAGDGDFLCHGGVPSSGECFLACCSWFCPAGFRARGLGWD